MTLQEKINADLRTAMLAKNEEVKSLLRVVIGEMNREGKVVADDRVTSILKKMVENAKLTGNDKEISILNSYLPQQLDAVQLNDIVSKLIAEKSYTSIKDMGKIMGDLKKDYAGQYDGKIANDIIKSYFAVSQV